jgi:hypothetical protein
MWACRHAAPTLSLGALHIRPRRLPHQGCAGLGDELFHPHHAHPLSQQLLAGVTAVEAAHADARPAGDLRDGGVPAELGEDFTRSLHEAGVVVVRLSSAAARSTGQYLSMGDTHPGRGIGLSGAVLAPT